MRVDHVFVTGIRHERHAAAWALRDAAGTEARVFEACLRAASEALSPVDVDDHPHSCHA